MEHHDNSSFYGIAASRKPERRSAEPATLATPQPVIGAAAIAEVLKISRRQVYRFFEGDPRRPHLKVNIPIRRRPGLGLVADRHQLEAWWAEFLRGENQQPH